MINNGKHVLLHRLERIANSVGPIDAEEVRTDCLRAIEEILRLETQIEDPRHVTISRERYFELLKYETLVERARVKIKNRLKELKCRRLSSTSQSRSSSLS